MLATRVEFAPELDLTIFSGIPDSPGVFLLRGGDGQSEPYVSKTANLRRRMQRLLAEPAGSTRRLNLRSRVRVIEYGPTGSDFESGLLLYQVLRSSFPKTYSDRLRLHFAPVIKLHLENQFPRASVTTRLSGQRSLYYGPFLTRATAEKFASDALDFFKMRRCIEDLHPDPAFPGCIYSEMKMCLAPCFKGCSDEEYLAEVGRVQALLDSRGESAIRELSAQRDRASSDLDFEGAAALHERIEKLKAVLAPLPAIVHRLDRLSGVMIQPAASPGEVALFRIDGGQICGPSMLPIGVPEHAKARSMEARVEEVLAAIPSGALSAAEAMEHLALLKRWYYRSSRSGEIFFADAAGILPMRRMVRGISRVYRGEKPEPDKEASSSSAVNAAGPELLS